MTLDTAAFELWGADQHGWRQATRHAYAGRCKRADAWLHDQRSIPLNRANLDDLTAFMSTVGRAPATRNGMRQALIMWYQWRGRATNPAVDLPRLRDRRRSPVAIAHNDVVTLMRAAAAGPPQWRVVIALLAFTGLRASEVCGLRWADLVDGWLHVEGKGGHERTVPVADDLGVLLDWWRPQCPSAVWILPGKHGPMTYQGLWYAVREIGDAAGVKVRPHLFRSTFATTLLQDGADVRTVQQLLGHANLQATSRYLAARDVAAGEAVQRLSWVS